MDSPPSIVTYSPQGIHTHTVVFLHGRDSTAEEFASELFESQASDDTTLESMFPGMKWIFPRAHQVPSARFGCEISHWYDMDSTEHPYEGEDDQDLGSAVQRVQGIIAQEASIIGASNMILAGISQGCAVGIHALLGHTERLGGFIGLCSWLPKREALTGAVNSRAMQTPVFLAHSEDDDVIALHFGEETREFLVNLGMSVTWKSYSAGGHWLKEPQGIDDIARFLLENVKPE